MPPEHGNRIEIITKRENAPLTRKPCRAPRATSTINAHIDAGAAFRARFPPLPAARHRLMRGTRDLPNGGESIPPRQGMPTKVSVDISSFPQRGRQQRLSLATMELPVGDARIEMLLYRVGAGKTFPIPKIKKTSESPCPWHT
jgi:hypothetical protein